MNLPAAFKVGGQWRFREDDVDAHIDRLSGRGQPDAAVEMFLAAKKAGRPRKAALMTAGSAT